MSTFVPKSRRTRFDLTLRILDLNNVPLVSGSSFVKWNLPSSSSAEHRGRTDRSTIREHRVAYEYEKKLSVRISVGKDGMLQPCEIQFEILQEYSAGGRGERIKLGDVRVNLAEYVDSASNDATSPTSPGAENGGGFSSTEEGVVRRYLMQDSKINSTLKLGIHLRHIEGTRDYFAPPLRTAPVFGGIAGIISSSEPTGGAGNAGNTSSANTGDAQDESSAAATMPNLSSKNKEMGEMQDLYRRTLAAFWASQPGELKADDCVEDIFSGGDGWGKGGRPEIVDQQAEMKGLGSGTNTPTGNVGADNHADMQGRPKSRGYGRAAAAGARKGGGEVKRRGERKGLGEVDEYQVREDLRSWRVGERAYG